MIYYVEKEAKNAQDKNWNLLTESEAWLWNSPKIGRNRKRKWNIFKTDRIDRICNRRPSGQNVTQSWTLYWMCVWKKMPHFCILLSPVKTRARRNDLRFSIRSGGGLRHGRWIPLWRTMVSQKKQWFRSVLPLRQESVTAVPCWRIWQVPETGRKAWDSGQERMKQMFRNGWMDWDCNC